MIGGLALRWQNDAVLLVGNRISRGGKMVSDWRIDVELTVRGMLNWH